MENEKKYIITIDGTDCTGKTTLWTKAILDSSTRHTQIRGIVSNIAYAIKFNRDVDELIDLYNQNPVNYVVYLINPINDKKLEMIYNRIRKDIYNNDKIEKELKDASETWNDMVYFNKAIELLKEKYKGEIIISKANDNDFEIFKRCYKTYEGKILTSKDIAPNSSVKVLKCNYTNFEKMAKEQSKFKYIMIFEQANKEDTIETLMQSLEAYYFNMFSNLTKFTDKSYEEIYDEMENKEYSFTTSGLEEYLDDYVIDCTSNITVTLNVSTNHEIRLSDLENKKYYDLGEVILDDSTYSDEINENLQNELQWAEYDSFDVEVNN